MAFLTLNGIEVMVRDGTFVEPPALLQGTRTRMRSNNVISTEDPFSEKRQFECQVDFYSAEDEAAVRAACPRGTPVPVGGDALGETIDALVDLGEDESWQGDVGDGSGEQIFATISVHIEEA